MPEAPTLSPFEGIARLYGPSDSAVPTRYIEAGAAWSLAGLDALEVGRIVWGNVPTDGHRRGRMLRWSPRRELALLRLRTSHGDLLRGVHRLPPAVRPGPVADVARMALLGGLLVELDRATARERTIDAVLLDYGARPMADPRLRPSRDGSALVHLAGSDGAVELRVAATGVAKDLDRNADSLQFLNRHATALVPVLKGRGVVADAAWTAETHIPGAQSRALDRGLLAEAARFCADLPTAAAPTSLGDHLRELAVQFPQWADLAHRLAERPTPWPGIVKHGDLWIGNLLADRGRLTGVIDWDSWHPAAMPGVDLLHLLAVERRLRTGEDIGAIWRTGLWQSSAFLSATARYWERLGIRPTSGLLRAIGLDWWSGQVLKRRHFLTSPTWLEQNVHGVLDIVRGWE